MSTSEQDGQVPLTRKQLRELRLTGATPIVAAEPEDSPASPSPTLPRAVEPDPVAPAPSLAETVDLGAVPLTRRQAREQERVRTASVPVVGAAETSEEPETQAEPEPELPSESDIPAEIVVEAEQDLVADVPAAEETGETPAPEIVFEVPAAPDAVAGSDAHPTVSAEFGEALNEEAEIPAFSPSFDELVGGDTAGSSNVAPSALIFTQAPTEPSLSGPVASTGEILVTGSYDLPDGLGSQGHAHGVADGKEADAVLIDGELPPTSSPTPIAASSAVSTSKPAGEVIRPPAPDKGNRIMITLAIVAGGLALALAGALIYAFATGIF